MAERIGITGDLEEAKFQLEKKFKNTRNWRSTTSFPSKKEAQEWEKQKSEELKCKNVPPGKPPKIPKRGWFGFYFEHDGPR